MCTYHREKESMCPPTIMGSREVGVNRREGGNQQGRCYVAVEVVGWLVGLHWRVGDAWRRWSHMCGSWYLLRFLFRVGILHMDEHGLFDGPGMAVNFLMHYVELVGVHGMSCSSAVVVYGGEGFEVFLYSFTQRSA